MGLRVFLITYDLDREGHEGIRHFFNHGYLPESEGQWISVQKSVRLLLSSGDARMLADDLAEHTRGGHIVVVDVTDSGFSGRTKPAVWEWLRDARARALAS
ncbi:hypothetical protein [Frigoribacterium sp. MCBA15_019]|uniref:hypothetical protein n=1 Tax=Frigoribacterium sp. MCBA15_019 TaxID=1898745 RepID=UPI0008DCB248|nr:hypothetical protein [Frigoribacterium sp. MCBA15_019]OII27290.1 hypothetical protein BIV04_01635 [Frigoribacterium sp. MCBA15_019]